MHPNAQKIQEFYTAIRRGEEAAADCYAPDASFEDIAFRLTNREDIRNMWRLVCSAAPVVEFDSVSADAEGGRAHWTACYVFGKTRSKPGRPVKNDTTSEFRFRDGQIVQQRDHADAPQWARQAYRFPIGIVLGRVGPLRRWGARRKLNKFVAGKLDS